MKFRIKKNKGQAALEFLMTYGWAILVVLIVIGALSYFGVLDPLKLAPDRCTFKMGFDCNDHKLTDTALTIRLGNSIGAKINVTNMTAIFTKGTLNTSCNDSTFISGIVDNQAEKTLTIPCSGSLLSDFGAKAKGKIVIHYTDIESGMAHTTAGEILAEVED